MASLHQNESHPRIDSSMAKYTSKGDLMCVLCGKSIKPPSQKLWNAHLISVKHKEMLQSLRNSINSKKEKSPQCNKSSQSIESLKTVVTTPEPPKQLKSILKNKRRPSEEPPVIFKQPTITETNSNGTSSVGNEDTGRFSCLPPKIPKLDNKVTVQNVISDQSVSEEIEDMDSGAPVATLDESGADSSQLPEGFFDDPKLDAKARNVEFVDPMEKELQEFQKIIQQEEILAENVQLEETALMLHDREIEQIEGQMSYFARAANLFERKRNQESTDSTTHNNVVNTANMDTKEVIEHFLKLENEYKDKPKSDQSEESVYNDVSVKLANGMRESIAPDSIYASNFIKSEPSDEESGDDDESGNIDLVEFDMSNWRKKSLIAKM